MTIEDDTYEFVDNVDLKELYADDERLLRQLAIDYITSFEWCPKIDSIAISAYIESVFALYYISFSRNIVGADDSALWVVVGDLPSAYFVADVAVGASSAIVVYCRLMQNWIDSILLQDEEADIFSVQSPRDLPSASSLQKRVNFLRIEAISLIENAAV